MKIAGSKIAVTGVALFCAAMGSAYAYDGAQYAKDAKVTMEQARAQALKIAPGTIKDAELEKEGGGSGLRYSFDIQTRKGLHEVGIDAVTGKRLENSQESRQAEAREARAEHEAGGGASDHAGEEGEVTVHQTGEHED